MAHAHYREARAFPCTHPPILTCVICLLAIGPSLPPASCPMPPLLQQSQGDRYDATFLSEVSLWVSETETWAEHTELSTPCPTEQESRLCLLGRKETQKYHPFQRKCPSKTIYQKDRETIFFTTAVLFSFSNLLLAMILQQ